MFRSIAPERKVELRRNASAIVQWLPADELEAAYVIQELRMYNVYIHRGAGAACSMMTSDEAEDAQEAIRDAAQSGLRVVK